MEAVPPLIESCFDGYAEMRAHWESLRDFFETWASRQDELLGSRLRNLEQLAFETEDRRKGLRPAGGPSCGVPVGGNTGKRTFVKQVHLPSNAIDPLCMRVPAKILQAEVLHSSPSCSSEQEDSETSPSSPTSPVPNGVSRTTSWTKAVLRPSNSGLWQAVENLRGTAEGRISMNERWFRPESDEQISGPRSKSRATDCVGDGRISRLSTHARSTRLSGSFQRMDSLRDCIQDMANDIHDGKRSIMGRGSTRGSAIGLEGRASRRPSTRAVRKMSNEKISHIMEKKKKRSTKELSDEHIPEELSCLKQFVLSKAFMAIGGLTILLNAVLIAVETEYEAATLSTLPWSTSLNMALNIWYACEMVLKMYAYRFTYFTGPEKRWNCLDTALVVTSVIDMAFTTQEVGEKHGMGRAMRAVRLIRLVRNLRLVRFFNSFYNFQRMVLALTSCMGTLFWSVVMLACVTWTFAVCMTQFVSSLRRGTNQHNMVEYSHLQEYFGNTAVGMHCLIQSATAGLSWGTVSTLLFSIDVSPGVLYLCYIFLTIFGVLNVVTSVFVESALQTSQHYRELLVEQNRINKEYYARHVREIFKVIDEDGSGLVSLPEIRNIFTDPTLQEFIDALEVNATDADMLFNLLDYDGSGEIDADEFCDGCLRLKGEAKSFDVYCMIYENERNLRFSRLFMEAIADTLTSLATHVNFLTQKLKDPSFGEEVRQSLKSQNPRRMYEI